MYRVEVEKGNLSFSAAHFITFGGKCERLHGHNYAVSVILAGNLTEDRYVFDFVELKKNIRRICDRLDHHFLLPTQSQHLDIKETDGEWEIRFENRRYVFPADDVLVLPVDSITAERLAKYICGQFMESVNEQERSSLTSITVGVEEAPGQTAFYQHSFQLDETPGSNH
jgi:6-pyruvoyltetrahydropterin/6-carboxytetrahydropterin synthase